MQQNIYIYKKTQDDRLIVLSPKLSQKRKVYWPTSYGSIATVYIINLESPIVMHTE